MSWITLTQTHLEDYLTGNELSRLQSAALADDQDNPIPDIIADVVEEVRGRVAANPRNTLGANGKIPDELNAAALAIVRWRVINRLPGLKSLATEERKDEKDDALRLLRDVAADKFSIAQPDTATEETVSGGGVSIVKSSTQRAGRDQLKGL